MKADIKKIISLLFFVLLLSACINSSNFAGNFKYEVGMNINEFLAENNLDIKDAKIEKEDRVEIIIFDLENDNKADVIILKNTPQAFDNLIVYDYEKNIAYIFPVGKSSGKILTPPQTAQINK